MQNTTELTRMFTPPPQICVNLPLDPANPIDLLAILNPKPSSSESDELILSTEKIYHPKKRCPWKVAGALGLMFGAAICVGGYVVYKALSERTSEVLGDIPVNRTGNLTTDIFDESNGSGSGMGIFDYFSNSTSSNATAVHIISEWD